MLLPQSCTALTAAGYVPRDTGGSEKDVPQYGNSLHIAGCDDPIGNSEGLNYITLTEEEESARS